MTNPRRDNPATNKRRGRLRSNFDSLAVQYLRLTALWLSMAFVSSRLQRSHSTLRRIAEGRNDGLPRTTWVSSRRVETPLGLPGNLAQMCLGADGNNTKRCNAKSSEPGNGVTQRAVDENWNQVAQHTGFEVAQATADGYLWWRLDLGQTRFVAWLNVWNVLEGSYAYNNNLYIVLGDVDDLASNENSRCWDNRIDGNGEQMTNFIAYCNAYGRYLFLVKHGDQRLHLNEVEVYGVSEKPDSCGEGWFWERASASCRVCPYNGSSVREFEGNAYGCRCPVGMFGDGMTCEACPFDGSAVAGAGEALYNCQCPEGYAMTFGVDAVVLDYQPGSCRVDPTSVVGAYGNASVTVTQLSSTEFLWTRADGASWLIRRSADPLRFTAHASGMRDAEVSGVVFHVDASGRVAGAESNSVYLARTEDAEQLPLCQTARRRVDSCVPSSRCAGVLDTRSNKCWRLARSGPLAWVEAEAACGVWVEGGHTASLASPQDLEVVGAVYRAEPLLGRQYLWVGAVRLHSGATGNTAADSGGEWSDGSHYERDPKLWQNNPFHPQPGLFCGALGNVTSLVDPPGLRMRSLGCDKSWSADSANMVAGYLCAATLCANDTYWDAAARACTVCPYNGSSVQGSNHDISACMCPAGMFGQDGDCQACPAPGHAVIGSLPAGSRVYSCRCPLGWALTVNMKEGGQDRVECAATASCDGFIDASSRRCWTLIDAGVGTHSYDEAATACRALGVGTTLASLVSDADMELAAKVWHANVPGRLKNAFASFWVGLRKTGPGGNTQDNLAGFIWEDNSPVRLKTSYWRLNLPDKHLGYSVGLSGFSNSTVRMHRMRHTGTVGVLGHRPTIHGFLCSTPPQCPNSTYWDGRSCTGCPPGATSATGRNFNVYACRCPAGWALAHNLMEDGEMRVRCVAANCEGGVWDVGQGACWQLHVGAGSWHAAHAACCAANASLASIDAHSDMMLASSLLWSFSFRRPSRLWLSALELTATGNLTWRHGGLVQPDTMLWAGPDMAEAPWVGSSEELGGHERCSAVTNPAGHFGQTQQPAVQCRPCYANPLVPDTAGFLCKRSTRDRDGGGCFFYLEHLRHSAR